MDGEIPICRPLHFPTLPPCPGAAQWSRDVREAHKLVSDTFDFATRILRQEDQDSNQLQALMGKILNDSLPVLEALEMEIPSPAWADDCAKALATTVAELGQAATSAVSMNAAKYAKVSPCTLTKSGSGGRGAPRKVIDAAWLRDALSPHRKITFQKIARILGMHRNTLRRHLKKHNVYHRFSTISDRDLDILVEVFKANKPNSGLSYLVGFLRSHGLRIQRQRVRNSVRRIDVLGRVLRKRKIIERRKYSVPRTNHLWHMDGHHKLILWGFVIHGFVDGYCRSVLNLRASTNNRAATVLKIFLETVQKYGVPMRVRGDRGGENIEVSVWMVMHRGPNRGSFLWGSSTHNTRIERLWVEVGRQFARRWKAFFTRLGRVHGLDRRNPHHLWLLHLLFLEPINIDCQIFMEEWNHHPISTMNFQSPSDLRFLSEAENGVYIEDCFTDVNPNLLARYYGTGGEPLSLDEQDDANELRADLTARVTLDMQGNLHDEPASVPAHTNPFRSESAVLVFRTALSEANVTGILPESLTFPTERWNVDTYYTHEDISVGFRRAKTLSIHLPPDIWMPRALAWAQGLAIMESMLLNTS